MNKMTKRIIALLLICIMLVPFAACKGDTPAADGTTTPAETTTLPPEITTPPPETTTPEPEDTDPPTPPDNGKVDISINGVDIAQYTIVIPAQCDLYTKYAAQNMTDYLKYNYDIELKTVTDATAPVDYELIIGATNRAGSTAASAVELAEDEFVMMTSGKSVVLYGESYMVGGAAGDLLYRHAADARVGKDVNITDIPAEAKAEKFVYETAQNAILLIGDGMGREHVNLTLANGLAGFSADDMPVRGMIITQSQSVIDGDAKYTDSAAAGTALSTAYKTKNKYIGVLPDMSKPQNVRELAHEMGAKTAVLSTDVITGATPSAFLAHYHDRDSTPILNNLINKVKNEGKVEFAKGSLGDSNFLSESVNAIQSISAKGSRFFAMIEEGQIDKKAHNNDSSGVIHTVKRFDTLIAYCMEFILFHPDTVLIVTADHETGGLTYNESNKTFKFTSKNHTNVDVPIYAMGSGTEYFRGETRDNTRVPAFISSLYGAKSFGDMSYDDGKIFK